MQLRSGRRLDTPPAPAPRGGVPRARPRRTHADREDRLSGLPVELRLEVLARLGCPREAARTSVLSSRWRGLWTELRDLEFDGMDLYSLDTALAMVRPEVNRLRLSLRLRPGQEAAAEISSLLRAADRLAPAELVVLVILFVMLNDYSLLPSASFIEMPLFKRATSIDLLIVVDTLSFRLPPAGDFDKLERLTLIVYGCENPSVFLPRCPRLRKLEMHSLRPLEVNTLAIDSKSLDELRWYIYESRAVHIVAPDLRKFTLTAVKGSPFLVSLSAQKLEEFCIVFDATHSRIGPGETWLLTSLQLHIMAKGSSSKHGQQGQLPRFHEWVLSIYIDTDKKPANRTFDFEEEVARLLVTDFRALDLRLRTGGACLWSTCAAASPDSDHHTKAQTSGGGGEQVGDMLIRGL